MFARFADDLHERIHQFNVEATGLADGRLLRRGRGLGSSVLAAAEEQMRRRGCTQVALSTHTFQGPGFYARRGYTQCGLTPDYPRGHAQAHLVKALA